MSPILVSTPSGLSATDKMNLFVTRRYDFWDLEIRRGNAAVLEEAG
jgi:hypothetical protein